MEMCIYPHECLVTLATNLVGGLQRKEIVDLNTYLRFLTLLLICYL